MSQSTLEVDPKKFPKQYRSWPFKNTTLLVVSIYLLILFAESPYTTSVVSYIADLGYVGIFLLGVLFVSVFTVVPAVLVLTELVSTYPPGLLALIAAVGAVVGDYLIFRFLRDRVFEELKPIFEQSGGLYLVKLFKTKYFSWLLPLVGALIIASPLPDESGIALLGVSRIRGWQFVLLMFVLNFLGLLGLLFVAR